MTNYIFYRMKVLTISVVKIFNQVQCAIVLLGTPSCTPSMKYTEESCRYQATNCLRSCTSYGNYKRTLCLVMGDWLRLLLRAEVFGCLRPVVGWLQLGYSV